MGLREHQGQPSGQAVSLGHQEKIVKKIASNLGARSKEERKQVRKNRGTLRSLTVQATTKTRYRASLDDFFDFLNTENLVLPTKRDLMDGLVSDYLEHLWAQGEGRATATRSTFLAALQDFDPKLKGNLPGSWRLMKT